MTVLHRTPQSATTTVKRLLREDHIAVRCARTSRTADDKFLTCVFMPKDTSDATYAKAVAVLTPLGYKVKVYPSTGWVDVVADAPI